MDGLTWEGSAVIYGYEKLVDKQGQVFIEYLDQIWAPFDIQTFMIQAPTQEFTITDIAPNPVEIGGTLSVTFTTEKETASWEKPQVYFTIKDITNSPFDEVVPDGEDLTWEGTVTIPEDEKLIDKQGKIRIEYAGTNWPVSGTNVFAIKAP